MVKSIVHDVKAELKESWYIYIGFILFVILTHVKYRHNYYEQYGAKAQALTYMEYVKHVFMGMGQLDERMTKMPEIPIEWLGTHVFVMIRLIFYPVQSYYEYGYQYLLRQGNYKHWWYGKVGWITVNSLFCCICIHIASIIMSLIDRGSFRITGMGIHAVTTIILPWLYFVCIGLIEMVLSICINSIFALIVAFSYTVAGIFFMSSIFLSNYTMIVRGSTVVQGGGFLPLKGMILMSVCLIAVCNLGYQLFSRKEIY